MVVAGEISGDLYGSDLIYNIRKILPECDIFGAGGPKMASAGMKLSFNSSAWGTIGLVEAIKILPRLYFIYKKLIKLMHEEKPDLLVLIDYPGLNMRLARYAKKIGIPVIYYFPPSKFVKDPLLVKDAANHIDYVAAPFVTTAKIYRDAGANVEFVGNPLVDIVKPTKDASTLKKEFNLSDKRIISVLPGSRVREIYYMLPALLGAVKCISNKIDNIEFIMPITSSIFEKSGMNLEYFNQFVRDFDVPVKIICDRTYDVLSITDLSIITSGTATLEAACLRNPMVIVYKVSKITELLAKKLSNLPDYIGMPNIILSEKIIPELIQGDVTAENIANECIAILNSEERITEIKKNLDKVIRYLGQPGAGLKVAKRIKNMLEM